MIIRNQLPLFLSLATAVALTPLTANGQAPAGHSSYGSGCYESASSSFYATFANATAASAALTGESMVLTPNGGGYDVAWGGGALLPVSGAAVTLPLTDDGDYLLQLPNVYPSPYGPVTQIRIYANGIISFGMPLQTFPGTNIYTPTPAGMLGGNNTAIYSWHDYNPEEGGTVTQELVSLGLTSARVITWNNVESYPTGTSNPSTLQFQFNLSTGVVTVVWQSIDSNSSSPYGSGHIVGLATNGSAPDPGPIDLATQLPLTTSTDLFAMSMSASPAPVSTAGSGTLVTYQLANVPDAVPGTGIGLGLTVISFPQDLPGTSLAFLGMPDCALHIGSLDVTVTMAASAGNGFAQLFVPPGIPPGSQIYAQTVALITPNSLPNGQNSFGATVSDAIASNINTF